MKKKLLLIALLSSPLLGLCQVNTSPVTNLEATVFDNDTVFLTWNLPRGYDELPMVLSWTRSDTIGDQIQYGMDSYMAHLFDFNDLQIFQGWRIDSVVFKKVCNWKHRLYIWKQVPSQEMEQVHVQVINEDAPWGKYTINLQEDLYIEPNTQYYFGIRAYWDPDKDRAYPFAVDDGPAVVGKGGLLMGDIHTGWDPISYSIYLYFNFWLQTFISNPNRENNAKNDNNYQLTAYRVYRDGELIREIPYSFVTYFKDAEFTRGFDVEYCVTAVYGEEESEPVCVTAKVTGVDEISPEDGVTLVPNPTNGLLRIEGETPSEVKVYNASGQLVKITKNTNEINLKDLPQGIYTLRITIESGSILTKKVVKE